MSLNTNSETVTNMDVADMTANKRDTLSFRLYRALQNKGLKQADLARATGISKDMVSQYVRGTATPRDGTLKKLAEALNVQPSDLMSSRLDGFLDASSDPHSNAPFELRMIPGSGGLAHLRVDCMLPSAMALQIANMIQEALQRTAENDLAS